MLAARFTSHRLGRFAVAAFAATVVGGLGFTSTQLLGVTVGNASVFAALVTVIAFFWGITILNLRLLGYFPRPSERFIDRAAGPAIAMLFGAFGILNASGFLAKVLVVVAVTAIVLHQGRTGRSTADLLGDGAIHPRSTADARTMLELLRQKQQRKNSQRGMFFTRLNTALALITLAESENTYRHLHDAYEILHGLAASASTVDPGTRLAVADALVETTSRLYQFGDSLDLYEQAADLLDHELRNSDLPYAEFRRLLTLADLKILQTGISIGPPADVTSRTSALREAVEHLRDALPIAPRHRRADLHFRLVVCHGLLAELLPDPSRRSEAIAHARLALQTITSSSREDRPYIEQFLAVLLLVECSETGSPSLAHEAERLADNIRSSRNPDARARGLQVRIWASQLRNQAGFPPQGPGLDLTAAAAEVTSLQPCSRARLQVAATLADWAADQNQAASAAWGYREALATARNISATGLVRKQQQAPLYEVGGFAAEAAHWLLERGRPLEAVEAIEAGRALVLSSAVHRDMLVRRLESFDPGLARRCAELSAQMARVDGHAWTMAPSSGQLWAVVSERRAARAAHDEWQRLSGWLRRWPEFRALLDPPGYGHVSAAAECQPLVYLIAARRTGYALIVMPRSRHPDVLRLPGLTSERVAEVAQEFRSETGRLNEPLRGRTHWQSALAGCLDWLRESAMQPLAGSLRSPEPVALIPVGDLALLPLHVACEIGGTAAVTYSYAPSAPVIAHATEAVRTRRLTRPANALVVASAGPQDQQLRYLDYAARSLKSHVSGVTELSGATATHEAALSALGSHDIYHFACHGAADGADPLESHLQVADGQLTVRDVLNQRLRGRLAVLAACETAVPYAQLPDESIGLPAALLEAGVPGVVATQWPVEEIPTMLLTTRFYEQWLRQRQKPPVALQKAQHWLRTRTYGQLETYVQKHLDGAVEWPYRHTGNARQHQMFAHPDHWAAFSYTGV